MPRSSQLDAALEASGGLKCPAMLDMMGTYLAYLVIDCNLSHWQLTVVS